jgi:hypothetical protein
MRLTLILFAFCSLLFASCSSVYMPNVPNTPMLSANGELHASGHVSLKGNVSLNTAYAVSDHIGVLANGSFMKSETSKKDFDQSLFEGGVGYFDTFGPDNSRIFELYAGMGTGGTDRIYKDVTSTGVNYDRQEFSFNKLFVQANYSSKNRAALRLFGKELPLNYGTALRISYLNMGKFTRNEVAQPTEDNVFLEPIFFTRLALSNSIQLQHTSGSNFGLMNRKFLTAGNSVFSFGIVINVGGKASGAPTPVN